MKTNCAKQQPSFTLFSLLIVLVGTSLIVTAQNPPAPTAPEATAAPPVVARKTPAEFARLIGH